MIPLHVRRVQAELRLCMSRESEAEHKLSQAVAGRSTRVDELTATVAQVIHFNGYNLVD